MAEESNKVILRAFIANVGIAVAKFAAAAMTGSSSMMTEGIHSVVDSVNEVLLHHGQKKSKKKPDDTHPMGYGRELYFWSFVVAILVFSLGSGLGIYEGIQHIITPEKAKDQGVAYTVLGISALLEGWSFHTSIKSFNKERGDQGFTEAFEASRDTPTLTVMLEDGAALIGLFFAAMGVALSHWTGNPIWDGVGSVLIGLLLGAVAIILLSKSKSLLIGEGAEPELVKALKELAAEQDGVEKVYEVLTLHQAPEQVVAVISADFDDRIMASDVENIIRDIEADVASHFPIITRLYVRPMEKTDERKRN